jgi:hypothetical protein
MAITLEQLVESGEKHARHHLLEKRDPELQAFYTLITDQNEMIILPCSFKDDFEKDVTVATVKATAVLCHAVKLVYISEAWMLKLPKALTPWHADRQMANLPKPSESPDRIEVVQIIASDGITVRHRALQMVRNKPGGKLISLIPMAELSDGERTNYMGRMIDGIIPPRKEAQ